MHVPCGKCVSCRVARAREWSVRLMHESSYYEASSFITLTYDDDHLPSDHSIHKEELQRFFKRVRKQLDDCVKIKYYACGEYGEKGARPHYHAIVFGLGIREKWLIDECWSLGYTYMGNVTYDSCRYVADYVQKKYSGDLAKRVYEGREIPFQLQSKGLGARFARENEEMLKDNLGCTVRGQPAGLPRYYKKILAIDTSVLAEKGAEARESVREHYSYLTDEQVYPAVQKARLQSEKTLIAKIGLRHKKL